MIKPEQIPDEVLAVFQRAWFNQGTLSTKECLAEAINAWTHAERRRWTVPSVTPSECDAIILPIIRPLGADFEKVWDDNAAQLYED